MSKHTPGPWKFDGKAGIEAPRGWVLAIVYPDEVCTDYPRAKNEAIANARLIAAAPELLAELKAAHRIIMNALNVMNIEQKNEWSDRNERDGVKDGMAVTREEKRRLAIAKAEGPPRLAEAAKASEDSDFTA